MITRRRVKMMPIPEYRRRVFNECMLECMDRIHGMILNGSPGTEEMDYHDKENMTKMASKMCRAFYNSELCLDTCTVDQTKKRLSEAVTFIRDCVDVCESIANDKAKCATEEGCEMDDAQKIELSDEDEELIDKLFDEKSPELQVDTIRDATVKALVAEDQKAQEIRDAMNIANSQVAAGQPPEVMKETVERINGRGPTSLMNAIINRYTAAAIKDVNENAEGGVASVGQVMRENADVIKTRSVMLYTLYEMANVFGIIKYTPAEVKKLTEQIYYNK